MGLLLRALALVEHARLAVVVGKALWADAALGALLRGLGKVPQAAGCRGARAVGLQAGGLIGHAALGHLGLHMAVALVVGERAFGRVDGQLREVGPAQARQLGVQVREQATLQQRVVAEIDAGRDIGRAEGHLLGLGEEVVGPAVQHEAADLAQRNFLFGDELGGVQVVVGQGVCLLLREQLHAQLPGWVVARLDGLEQVTAVVVVVCGLQLERLVPDRGLDAQLGPPVEFHEGAFTLGIDQPEAVHAKALDHAQAACNGAVAHDPHDHVHGLGHEGDEVPERVVRRGGLRKAPVGFHLHGMDQVGKLHGVLDEEDRDVVAHQIPVALFGIELDGKAAHIARGIHRARSTGHGGEAHEDRHLLAGFGQDLGGGVLLQRICQLEITVGACAACMDDSLWNALMVEMRDFLAQDEIFQQRRAFFPGGERVLIIRNRNALLRGQSGVLSVGLLL